MQILLDRDDIETLRFDGKMSRIERDQTLTKFKKQGGPKILLISFSNLSTKAKATSLKCGGFGLNLTEANRVICMDLAWNAATENQAIDRVHRMGQVKSVFVKRLVVKDTIEDRILKLQAQKQGLSDAALGEGTGAKMPRMNVAQLKTSLPSKGKATEGQSSSKSKVTSTSSPSFPRGGVAEPASSSRASVPKPIAEDKPTEEASQEIKNLRKLVLGIGTAGEELVGEPGRYLALDCEMVGVGEDGKESSLARASIVDYHGRVVLDEFVQQRERVTDYRTQYSGIRPEDMIAAKSFGEIQSRVAELLAPADRILVGHALSNDLAALLLTHPASRTRDTQLYAGKKPPVHPAKPAGKGKQNADAPKAARSTLTLWEKYRTPRIALKKLAKEELV
ncbi:3'-5' exonuclease [Ceratobasidium sp. 392]|nr:3'-5' exonuclease [Ceratobasidium sp. 392]